MAVSVTSEVMALNTVNPITYDAATADTADLAEVFTFTPAIFCNKFMLELYNVSAVNGTITYSIAAGAAWAADEALTGSVEQGVNSRIVIESGKYLSADGTYVVTITPASGKKLLTDHGFKAAGVAMP